MLCHKTDEEAAEAGTPGNSHMINTTTANTHAAGTEEGGQRKSTQEDDANPRKEKSVLQAKLTKLAIQIGYGGTYI